MFSFLKNKNFRKISILLGISLTLFLILFINENLNLKKLSKYTNNELFFKKFENSYNDFFEIKKITLNGRSNSNLNLIKDIVNSKLNENKNIINYDIVDVKNSLEELNWVNEVSVRKIFPSQIIVDIKEHKEFAVYNEKNVNFLISEEGNIIHQINNTDAYELIHLEGKSAIKNINKVKNFLIENEELKKQISKIIVFPNNRWDVITNDILFKLPNKNSKEAVGEINKFINLENLEIVDLRFFEKKIFIKINAKEIALRNKK